MTSRLPFDLIVVVVLFVLAAIVVLWFDLLGLAS
jgi:hypothetical protein